MSAAVRRVLLVLLGCCMCLGFLISLAPLFFVRVVSPLPFDLVVLVIREVVLQCVELERAEFLEVAFRFAPVRIAHSFPWDLLRPSRVARVASGRPRSAPPHGARAKLGHVVVRDVEARELRPHDVRRDRVHDVVELVELAIDFQRTSKQERNRIPS